MKKGQLLATIAPDELRAETAYYAQNAQGLTSRVRESEAALRLEQTQVLHQTTQAGRLSAALEAQVLAGRADVGGGGPRPTPAPRPGRAADRLRPGHGTKRAPRSRPPGPVSTRSRSRREAQGGRPVPRANAEQVTVRRSRVQATQHLEAAAAAQSAKANVRLAYAELKAPIDGQVDVRAVR